MPGRAALLRTTVALCGVITAFLVIAAGNRPRVPVVEACSGEWPSLDELAPLAEAMVVVRTLSVGGSDYLYLPATATPTRTATATPTWSPTPTAPAPPTPTYEPLPTYSPAQLEEARLRRREGLTGFGARVQTLRVLFGSVEAEFDLDTGLRKWLEAEMRDYELWPPYVILPCPFGFLTPRYEPNKVYVLLMKKNQDGWATLTPYFRADQDGNVIINYLEVSIAVRDQFFADLPAKPYIDRNRDGNADTWIVTEAVAPLELMRDAVLFIRGELPPQAPPPSKPPPRIVPPDTGPPPRIVPPDTGDAGLR